MAMEVIPAVDLSGGRVVRLLQGDYGRVTGFDETPDEAADRFALAGAGWLHVIDLDAARDGERSSEHAAVLQRLARRRGTRLQVGGGFRSAEQVEAALAAGVQRVLIGTLAARDPDAVAALAELYGPRICVCADALDGTVRIAGWREDAGESANAFVERFTTLIGMPPIRYLTIWRLQAAKLSLRESRKTIAQLAQEVGYGSEESFSRAFKRKFGLSPARWRDQQPAD